MIDNIVIVGAGAAGISAGLTLQELGVPFMIVEANDRIGGRAYTDTKSLPTKWDQGCSWFHCADVNPLVNLADKHGSIYDRSDRTEKALLWHKNSWADPTQLLSIQQHIQNSFAEIYNAAKKGQDVPISEILLKSGIESNITDMMVTLMCSENAKNVSAYGYGDYQDTNVNLMVQSGYGDLFKRMAIGLPIKTGLEVCSITDNQFGLKVHTSTEDIKASAVIITVSTNVLNSGQITFPSGPVQQILELIQKVPCGTYEKVAIALNKYPFDPMDNEALWATSYAEEKPAYFQIGRSNQPMLIAHIAGKEARDLVDLGQSTMIEFATTTLSDIFGSSFKQLIIDAAATNWHTNRFVQGGYSYTQPGSGQSRRDMTALDTGLITFAGEAFSVPWFGTAHGAFQSGKEVAIRLAKRLGFETTD